MRLLCVWSLRRVLLAGKPGIMLRAMQAQLYRLGARVYWAGDPLTGESLCRTLHEGRFSCVIVPDLFDLCAGGSPERLAALDMLIHEAREAGVPLVMLLCPSCDAHEEDAAPLLSHAHGWSFGAFGDPVSVQCIRHADQCPENVCCEALKLGARFLAGEQACTGLFTLKRRTP